MAVTAKEMLDQVILIEFVASRTSLVPFETSTLKWNGHGPDGVAYSLDGVPVHEIGTLTVRPFETHEYVLRARVGQVSRVLGSVTVSVDTAGCGIAPLIGMVQFVQGRIEDFVEHPPADEDPPRQYSLRFPTYSDRNGIPHKQMPEVWIEGGWIHFRFRVSVVIPDSPNPAVDFSVKLRLGVNTSGQLFPIYGHFHVDVHFPEWMWLLPGAAIWLSHTIGDIRSTATTMLNGAVQGAVRALQDDLQTRLPPLRALTEVQLITADGGGTIIIGYCPRSGTRGSPTQDEVILASGV